MCVREAAPANYTHAHAHPIFDNLLRTRSTPSPTTERMISVHFVVSSVLQAGAATATATAAATTWNGFPSGIYLSHDRQTPPPSKRSGGGGLRLRSRSWSDKK